ncbi:MAG: hypothetical protein RMY29_004530 [Nostoc sp. CreGUA01]
MVLSPECFHLNYDDIPQEFWSNFQLTELVKLIARGDRSVETP